MVCEREERARETLYNSRLGWTATESGSEGSQPQPIRLEWEGWPHLAGTSSNQGGQHCLQDASVSVFYLDSVLFCFVFVFLEKGSFFLFFFGLSSFIRVACCVTKIIVGPCCMY